MEKLLKNKWFWTIFGWLIWTPLWGFIWKHFIETGAKFLEHLLYAMFLDWLFSKFGINEEGLITAFHQVFPWLILAAGFYGIYFSVKKGKASLSSNNFENSSQYPPTP